MFLKKLFLVFLILLLVTCAWAFWFVASHGRGLIVTELERATGKKVSLGSARPVFPAGLLLEDVRIDGLARVPKAFIVADARALLDGRLQIASVELYSPEINIHLTAPAVAPQPEVLPSAPSQGKNKVLSGKPATVIGRVKVHGGVVMVQAPSTGKTWILEDVQADLRSFSLDAAFVKTDFFISASLARMNMPFVGHLVKARGWVNWAARDMDADVEAVDVGGRVGLSAVLKSRANNCEVKGRAHLSSSQPTQASGKKSKMIESTMLDLLSSLKTDIAVDFSFRTPLDRFDVGKVSIAGNITTGLQSEEISGNIVGSLKAAGQKFLQKDAAMTIKPYK